MAVKEIEGMITLQDEIVTVNEIPVSKMFLNFNGKKVKLLISGGTDTTYEYEGIADIFYYEGNQPYYRGMKYVNDFFIDQVDILEVLEKHKDELVTINMGSYWESIV